MVVSYDHNQSLGYLTGLANRLLSHTLAARFKATGIDMVMKEVRQGTTQAEQGHCQAFLLHLISNRNEMIQLNGVL